MATYEPFNKRYTGAASGDILFTNDRSSACVVSSLVVAAANGNTLAPDVIVKAGSKVIGDHPGVPAGGGFVVNSLIAVGPGDSVTMTTTDPGGTLAITFFVDWTDHHG